jgi:ribosome biogenesis GTPase A
MSEEQLAKFYIEERKQRKNLPDPNTVDINVYSPQEIQSASEIFQHYPEFITSVANPEELPKIDLPEVQKVLSWTNRTQFFSFQIAFAGRSNVGKSSLLNCVTNSKVVRTSSTPVSSLH